MVEAENGAEIIEVYGYPHQLLDWGARIDLGGLQYGQSRDAVLRLKVPALESSQSCARVTLKFRRAVGPTDEEEVCEADCIVANNGGVDLAVQHARLLVATAISKFATQKWDYDAMETEREALLSKVSPSLFALIPSPPPPFIPLP